MMKRAQSLIALSLMNLTFFGSVAAFANVSSSAQTSTPELTLISQALTIDGAGLSQEQASEAMIQNLKDYQAVANPEGQSARLHDALVSLKVFNSTGADEFLQETASAATPLPALKDASAAQQDAAVQTALKSLAAPEGAQYASCSTGSTIDALASAAWLFGSVFAMSDHNLTAHQQDAIIGGGFGALAAVFISVNHFGRHCR